MDFNMDNLEEQFKTPDVPIECLGMPLFGREAEDIGHPLDAFVIVKSIVDGEICYQIMSTETLTHVECIGMVEWAKSLILDTTLLLRALGDDDEDDEDDD